LASSDITHSALVLRPTENGKTTRKHTTYTQTNGSSLVLGNPPCSAESMSVGSAATTQISVHDNERPTPKGSGTSCG